MMKTDGSFDETTVFDIDYEEEMKEQVTRELRERRGEIAK